MKRLAMKNNTRISMMVVLMAIVSGIGTLTMPLSASAIGDWVPYGGYSEGYFSNNGATDVNNRQWCTGSYSDRCPVLTNDNYARDALDQSYYTNNGFSSVDRANGLANDLRARFNNGNPWDRAGAAFIANTMLGRGSDSSAKTRNVSDADWNTIRDRLVDRASKGRIVWQKQINANGLNTIMQRIGGNYDVMYTQDNEVRTGLEILNDDGTAAYRIWYSCANPIGNFSGLPAVSPPSNWSINGQSYVKNAGNSSSPNWAKDGSQTGTIAEGAAPGDWIGWYHDLRNNGPNNTSSVYFQTEKTGGFPASYTTQPRGNASGAPGSLFVHEYANYSKPTTSQLRYRIQEGDIGKTLCQRIIWLPGSSSQNTWFGAAGGGACVNVPYNFELVPSVGLTPNNPEPGTPVKVTTNVTNNGKTKSTPNAQWQFVQVRVNPGSPIPQIGDDTRSTPGAPCAGFYAGTGVNCNVLQSGTEAGGFPKGPSGLPGYDLTTPDVPVGTKICFGLSVQPQSHTSNNWKHSQLECIIVSKKPSINVTGSDVIVGRSAGQQNIVTSLSSKNVGGELRTFGSWGEYALIADGTVTGMASAAGLSGGRANASIDPKFCAVSYLTIANAGKSTCGSTGAQLGGYNTNSGAPAIASGFPTPSANISSGALPTGSKGVYGINGATLTIEATNIPRDRSVVINAPDKNVVINGNISYDGGEINTITQIPQVVIIANNITINEGVTNVDAWLIASGAQGTINTCNVGGFNELTSQKCNQPLVVNGPVQAKKLNLYRTAGANTGNDTRQPAETFNLRPDAYLWATGYRNGSSFRLQTTNTVELPPRY